MSLFSDFALALGQLTDRRFLWVLLKSLGLTILVFLGLYVLAGFLASLVGSFSLPLIGTIDPSLALGTLAIGALLIASAFLMIPVAAICVGFFLEDIAAAVEDRHYPTLRPVEGLPLSV
ncbi:MAG: EI24 domain-containing protein, partial [Pseudomonadota bacterium]